MENGTYTTVVTTKDGKKYDLGKKQYRPFHQHDNNTMCPGCIIADARTVLVSPRSSSG